MVNVDEINGIIDSLKQDATNIHEISQLCLKITEIGGDLIEQQKTSEINTQKIESIARTMSEMQTQYNNALNKLSAATDVLETSATELRSEMKRFANDSNLRLEEYREKTSAQLQTFETSVTKSLSDLKEAQNANLQSFVRINESLFNPIQMEIKQIKIFAIIGAVCAFAAAVLAILI